LNTKKYQAAGESIPAGDPSWENPFPNWGIPTAYIKIGRKWEENLLCIGAISPQRETGSGI
jgi:hypothetical protein